MQSTTLLAIALPDRVWKSLVSVRSSIVVATPLSLRQVPLVPICTHCDVGRLLLVDVDWQIASLVITSFGLEIEKLPPPTYSSPRPNRKCPDSCSSTHE